MIFVKDPLKKIHHLIRYTLLIGVISYIIYVMHLVDAINLFMIGPAVHIAYQFKEFLLGFLPLLPSSQVVDDTVFLLPVTLFYFGFVGFLIKTLLNERGRIRTISIVALILFLIFIHLQSGLSLLTYLTVQS